MRRDKLNAYIAELARLVPLVFSSSRKLDKASVLRLTVTYLRIYHGKCGVCVCVYMRPFVCISICVYVYVRVCVYLCVCVCVCVCLSLCMFTYVYACVL